MVVVTSATVTDALGAPDDSTGKLGVVLCGTFHRSPGALRATYEELQRFYRLLSPRDVNWVDATAEFVRLPEEAAEAAASIEGRHIGALEDADFVWLFCPAGYVGRSAAMEIGFAHALGVPVLTDTAPRDEVLASIVTVVADGARHAGDYVVSTPGSGIAGLQRYYARVARRRGWDNESARDTMLLLTEEIGELARAVRRHTGLSRDASYEDLDTAAELADVQLYLVHLANALGIDLGTAVTDKERLNAKRVAERAA